MGQTLSRVCGAFRATSPKAVKRPRAALRDAALSPQDRPEVPASSAGRNAYSLTWALPTETSFTPSAHS
jgi:hypothetical protein